MFLIIDNYDSFTYNLVQAFYTLGLEPVVMYNDDPKLLAMAKDPDLEMVCISPGPGHPKDAGQCLEFLNILNPQIPVLGICLGHQILGMFAGASIEIAPCIMHGKQSDIVHDNSGLFSDLPVPMNVGRYHSLVVRAEGQTLIHDFHITARAPEGEIMGLQYRDRPWVGVQFHPESVLTPEGIKLLGNFPQKIISQEQNPRINETLECLYRKEDLTGVQFDTAFGALMDGRLSQAQAGAFLMGLKIKGESDLELAHAIRAALTRSVRVEGIDFPCIDVVGTGGDGRNSFNCSTLSSLVLAGMGYKVVKHGNRAVSSKCGSADAIEALGISLDAKPEAAAEAVKQRNFAFLFAPHFHPAFKNVGPIRKELGMSTLFNVLGPMINPARPSHLLMGVARPQLMPLIAKALSRSPLERAAIICGAGDYDELTPLGVNHVLFLEEGEIKEASINPEDFGFKLCHDQKELAVESKEEAVAVLKELLEGRGSKAMLDMASLNVGLGIFLLEKDVPLAECMKRAKDAVYQGLGRKVLHAA